MDFIGKAEGESEKKAWGKSVLNLQQKRKGLQSILQFATRIQIANGEGKVQQLVPQQPFESSLSHSYILACKEGDASAIEQLLVLDKFLHYQHDHFGLTGVHWATVNGHLKALETVSQFHKDFDVSDQLGNTPLFYSLFQSNPQVVRFLI